MAGAFTREQNDRSLRKLTISHYAARWTRQQAENSVANLDNVDASVETEVVSTTSLYASPHWSYQGRCKQELIRKGVPDEAHVDDHWSGRRAR
jgi:hypothetical protein